MKYIWQYNGQVERTISAGTLWFQIKPANGQIVDIYLMRVKNDSTARNLRIHQAWVSDTIFYFDGTEQEYFFPSKDYLGTFKKAQPDEIKLFDVDVLTIENLNVAVGEKLDLTIRAITNIYARPTITVFTNMKFNENVTTIKGEIE